jgi:hypothetical protein
MLRISRNRSALLLGALATIAIACHGQNLPQSAQRGSTVLIPFGGNFASDPGMVVGYGGVDYADPQRGTMIFQLGEEGGFELTTRATTTVLAHPATQHAREGDGLSGRSGFQHLSVVDIPLDAPLGTHDLFLVRRPSEGSDIAAGFLQSTISILPEVIDAGGVQVVGIPTPFAGWICPFGNCSLSDASGEIPAVVPDPLIRTRLSENVWAVELEVQYPPARIDIVDALHVTLAGAAGNAIVTNNAAMVFLEDDGEGTAIVSAAGHASDFRTLAVVFRLGNGETQPLDVAEVPILVRAAYAENGFPLSSVSVANKSIR